MKNETERSWCRFDFRCHARSGRKWSWPAYENFYLLHILKTKIQNIRTFWYLWLILICMILMVQYNSCKVLKGPLNWGRKEISIWNRFSALCPYSEAVCRSSKNSIFQVRYESQSLALPPVRRLSFENLQALGLLLELTPYNFPAKGLFSLTFINCSYYPTYLCFWNICNLNIKERKCLAFGDLGF